MQENKSPIIFGDGSQVRDFIYVEDVVMANLLSMTSDVSNLLVNIGAGNAITILELANMVLEISELDLKPIFKDPLEGDIKQSHANITLATESFNWKPEKDLREWLSEVLIK